MQWSPARGGGGVHGNARLSYEPLKSCVRPSGERDERTRVNTAWTGIARGPTMRIHMDKQQADSTKL